MRGKQKIIAVLLVLPGITPAHAGKTELDFQVAARMQDHPRACGENCVRLFVSLIQTGSPPRMRGKQTQEAQ